MRKQERETDWFAVRLRQYLIRDSWPHREAQRRIRPDWSRQPVQPLAAELRTVAAAAADQDEETD